MVAQMDLPNPNFQKLQKTFLDQLDSFLMDYSDRISSNTMVAMCFGRVIRTRSFKVIEKEHRISMKYIIVGSMSIVNDH